MSTGRFGVFGSTSPCPAVEKRERWATPQTTGGTPGAPKRTPGLELDLLAAAADAKGRICLYGSNNVIHAFATFERLGAVISSAKQQAAFVAMVVAMRKDSGNSTGPETDDMGTVLLGSRD